MGNSRGSSTRSAPAWSTELGPSRWGAGLSLATGSLALLAVGLSEPPSVPGSVLAAACILITVRSVLGNLRPPLTGLAWLPHRGWRLRGPDGVWRDCRPDPDARLLGPVVSLSLVGDRRTVRLCLLRDQVPPPAWRRLRATLRTARTPAAGQGGGW